MQELLGWCRTWSVSVFIALDSSAASRVFFVFSSTGFDVSSDILSLDALSLHTQVCSLYVYATSRARGCTAQLRELLVSFRGSNVYQASAMQGLRMFIERILRNAHVGSSERPTAATWTRSSRGRRHEVLLMLFARQLIRRHSIIQSSRG